MTARRPDAVASAAVLLAAVAFSGSFDHVRATVAQHGQGGWLSWAIAAMPEVSVALVAVKLRRDGPRQWWAWLTGGSAMVFTALANLAQAEPTAWGYAAAVWPVWASIGAAGLIELQPRTAGAAAQESGPAAVTAPAAGPAINPQGPDPRRPGQEETWSSTARPAGIPGSSTPSRGASPQPLTPPAGPLSAPAPAAGLAAASSHPAGPRPVPTDPGDRPGQLYIEADLIAAARPVVAGLRMRGRAVNYKNLAPALREQGHQVGRAKAEALIAALSAA